MRWRPALLGRETPRAAMLLPAGQSYSYGSANGNQAANQNSLARVVSPGFFHLLAIPLLQGRAFTEGDSETAPRVAIVNQNFAWKVFGTESPVGKSIMIEPGGSPSIPPGPVQIVGLAANIKELGLDEIVFKDIYLPF